MVLTSWQLVRIVKFHMGQDGPRSHCYALHGGIKWTSSELGTLGAGSTTEVKKTVPFWLEA